MIRVTVTDNGRLVARDVVEHEAADLEHLTIPLTYRGHEVKVLLEFGVDAAPASSPRWPHPPYKAATGLTS